jgi:hypothetical protein
MKVRSLLLPGVQDPSYQCLILVLSTARGINRLHRMQAIHLCRHTAATMLESHPSQAQLFDSSWYLKLWLIVVWWCVLLDPHERVGLSRLGSGHQRFHQHNHCHEVLH